MIRITNFIFFKSNYKNTNGSYETWTLKREPQLWLVMMGMGGNSDDHR